MSLPIPLVRRVAALFAALLILVQPALSTWSIVVVNTKIGEVGVATATCLVSGCVSCGAGLDLQRLVPVIVPGKGGGATQAAGDSSGQLRSIIRRGLTEGWTPDQILTKLSGTGGFQSRQVGIANLNDPPVTFTGALAGAAKGGVTGIVGDLRYAIQGNVLTGPEVWLAAESRLLQTTGDLGERIMAAMEAARAFGGDGRCSCTTGPPPSCGAPPPNFTKSAHTACVVIARIGDSLGTCNALVGCANGSYYMNLNFAGLATDPDPVNVLQNQYTTWRAQKVGRPDQVYSQVSSTASSLPADGQSRALFLVSLFDIDNQAITHGGHTLDLENLNGPMSAASVSNIADHGNGSYTVTMTAGTIPGLDKWRITAADSFGRVVLQPDLLLQIGP